MNRLLFVFTLLIGCTVEIFGQTFKLRQPEEVTSADPYLQLSFVLDGASGTDFQMPSIEGFRLLSATPGISVSSQRTVYTLLLRPLRSGTFNIGSAKVKANGKILASKPCKVVVHKGEKESSKASGIKGMQHIGTPIKKSDIYVSGHTSMQDVYFQQPVLLTYSLNKRIGVAISNLSLASRPDFSGMLTEMLPDKQSAGRVHKKKGKVYRSIDIISYLVYPQREGLLKIPSMGFDCTVAQQADIKDSFDAIINGGGIIGKRMTLQSEPLTLHVRPLPKPIPSNFFGGVGRFKVKLALHSDVPRAGDVATLRLTVSGRGNLQLLTTPKINFPADFNTYEPKLSQETKTGPNGVEGDIYYDFTFVPSHPGSYIIPAVDWTYFDIEKKSYVQLRTSPLTIKVREGGHSSEEVDAMIARENDKLRPIRPTSMRESTYESELPLTTFITILAFILGLFALTNYALLHPSLFKASAKKQIIKETLLALEKLEKEQSQISKADYYSRLAEIIRLYISKKWSVPLRDINVSELQQVLSKKGVSEEESIVLKDILMQCEYAAYAPIDTSSENSVLAERLKNIL